MNPSFIPPIPVSNTLRTTLYNAYMADPLQNDVRELARKYHLSMKRVDAILRLKGHENAWIQEKKTLQTGFLAGMEHLLGVKRNREARRGISDEQPDSIRHDVDEADALEEEEKRDRARQKYQRMFWEPVSDGGAEPTMPGILDEAKDQKRQTAMGAKATKYGLGILSRQTGTSDKVVVVEKPGRPKMTFVDVGGKFIDLNDHAKRMAESQRRKRIKTGRQEERSARLASKS